MGVLTASGQALCVRTIQELERLQTKRDLEGSDKLVQKALDLARYF